MAGSSNENRRNEIWTQLHELHFLERLGTFREGAPTHPEEVSPYTRIDLLRGYLSSMDHKRRWFAGANPLELKEKANELLDRELVRVRLVEQMNGRFN